MVVGYANFNADKTNKTIAGASTMVFIICTIWLTLFFMSDWELEELNSYPIHRVDGIEFAKISDGELREVKEAKENEILIEEIYKRGPYWGVYLEKRKFLYRVAPKNEQPK